MNCGVDRQQLAIMAGLIECGVNPEALAHVMNEMRAEAATFQNVNKK